MLCPPHPPDPLVQHWLERHRGVISFSLHMIGIPATILGGMLLPVYVWLVSIPIFLLALSLFVGGFLIQFLAHALEGSEPGEVTALKAWWGRTMAARTAARPASRGVVRAGE